MKYFASIETERGSRPAKKGSNEQLFVKLFKGNREIGLLTFGGGEVAIEIYEPKLVYGYSDTGHQFTVPSSMVRFDI